MESVFIFFICSFLVDIEMQVANTQNDYARMIDRKIERWIDGCILGMEKHTPRSCQIVFDLVRNRFPYYSIDKFTHKHLM